MGQHDDSVSHAATVVPKLNKPWPRRQLRQFQFALQYSTVAEVGDWGVLSKQATLAPLLRRARFGEIHHLLWAAMSYSTIQFKCPPPSASSVGSIQRPPESHSGVRMSSTHASAIKQLAYMFFLLANWPPANCQLLVAFESRTRFSSSFDEPAYISYRRDQSLLCAGLSLTESNSSVPTRGKMIRPAMY
ncbi:hypothetical protein BCV70DRAFT_23082 [Testicularia cyperi]|uniref:Uncharacterized protein n=1 Tax=Testicularia cyperi TaxID=1882483 RepID=A0A317Y2I0_9BASI|nr:hypothetical protein BCV70DRAFT_23082 [Testicularia cyperi]